MHISVISKLKQNCASLQPAEFRVVCQLLHPAVLIYIVLLINLVAPELPVASDAAPGEGVRHHQTGAGVCAAVIL